MIMRVLILTGMLQLTVCLGAQVTGITETGAIAKTAAETQVQREWQNTIQNVSKQEIVALHVTFSCTTEDGRGLSDENGSVDKLLQFETDRLIPPGGSYLSKVIEPGDCTSRTDAVVYANGEVEGDTDKIDLIFQRRSGAYKALSVVIPLLDEIASGQSKASDIIATLRERIQARSNDRSLSFGEITGEGVVFAGAISLLQNHAWLRTPSDSTANRQPRIEAVMKTRGISLEQAHAFVTANKFREWQSALKDHTTPPGEN
ncbi:MAG: hypothetical protein ABR924_06455 [Terracidiphilus sp.]|jgi:hypothetical protein